MSDLVLYLLLYSLTSPPTFYVHLVQCPPDLCHSMVPGLPLFLLPFIYHLTKEEVGQAWEQN